LSKWYLNLVKRKALVAGGAGFIGSHLCKKLFEKNYDVIAYDDLSNGSGKKNLPNKIKFVNGSILNPKKLKEVCKNVDVKTKKMSVPIALELAKIVVDTSYYGWLINYAQLSNMIAIKNKVDYDEMWSFAEEIHKNLENRPKMYPGFIGGHCVIPNLELIKENSLYKIDKINSMYARKVKNSKSIRKKYKKSKKTSYDI